MAREKGIYPIIRYFIIYLRFTYFLITGRMGRDRRELLFIKQPNKPSDRVDPFIDIYAEQNRQNHLERYLFSNHILDIGGLDGEKHLDAACGVGYGSALLSVENYYGVDIDPQTIEYASTHYDGTFTTAAGDNLPFPGDTFSTITCIETLEHVPNDVRLLKELSRVLKEDGEIILTVPNDQDIDDPEYSEEEKSYPHVNSYTFESISNRIEEIFPEFQYTIYGQFVELRGLFKTSSDEIQESAPPGFYKLDCIDSDPKYLAIHIHSKSDTCHT